jgi:MFS family permease
MKKLIDNLAGSPKWRAILFLLIVSAACIRITRTYSFYNESIDEHIHIYCGMEWLDLGTFTVEAKHPPLPRVLMALGPYLRGARFDRKLPVTEGAHKILEGRNDYWGTLSAARVATLFWFVLACVSLYLFAASWCGGGVALFAVFLFSLLPSVLTHAGLATTDMAATAGLMFVLYSFSRYWGRPNSWNAALSGAALAVAIGSKLSLLLFIPLAVGPFVLALGLPWKWSKAQWLRSLAHGAVFLVVTLFCLSAIYRFELTPVARLGNLPLPLNGLKIGIRQLIEHNSEGHDAVFWGVYSKQGSRLFFPVMLALKTPLGILFLAAAGYVGLFFRWKTWGVPVRIAFFALPLIVAACMTSRINLGVRHVLPVYPMMALAGALGLSFVSRRIPAMALRGVLGAALLAACVESATAVNDPLPWFNVLAPHPRDLITVDSDLDWGQNIYRLSKYLKEAKIDKVGIVYFGSVPIHLFDFPKEVTGVWEEGPTPGYVVVSSYVRRLDCLKSGKFCWLQRFQPEHSIGDALHIYYIPKMDMFRP